MSSNRFIISFFLFLLLAACSSATPLTATPIPAQQVWKVAYTAPLALFTQDFQTCLDPQLNTTILVEEVQDPAGFSGYDFGFYWGDIQNIDQPAFVIGYDQLKVVVNSASPLNGLSTDEIKSIFNGSITRWEQLKDSTNGQIGDIHVWLYPQQDSFYRIAEQMGWIQQVNRAVNLVAPDPDAMRVEIENDPAAIGILPGIWLSDGVKALVIEGESLQAAQQPVLVVTPDKPQGTGLDWLLCLQKAFSERTTS